MPRIDRLRATFKDEASFQRVLGLLYSDITEFFQRTYKLFRRRAWRYWFPADWALFQRRFRSILGKLEAHCDMLDKEAAAIHFTKMREDMERRKTEDEEFEKQRQLQMTREVVSSLSGESADEQEDCHHRLSNARLLRTCDWVLPHTQSWIDEESTESLLWMVGIPGAGKSMVSSFLIEHLSTDSTRTLLYFFCGKAPGNRETCSKILSTFAVQHLRQHPEMAPLVHQTFVLKGSNRSISGMKSLVKELLKNNKCTRIILDGLDEYKEDLRKEILVSIQDILCDLPKLSDQSHKLLISSRDLPQIDRLIRKRTRISLNKRPLESLHIYISGLVDELKSSLAGYDDSVFEKIQGRLQEKAKGMFLYVRLVKDMLETCGSQADLEDSLERLPDGLDEAYGLILERIENLGPELARSRVFRVLFWLCAAYRPLSVHEIADGIVLKSNCTTLNKKTRIRAPEVYILDKCRPLIQSRDGTLELVHFTAKEYLLDEHSGRHRSNQSSAFISLAEAHHGLAFACIANLNEGLQLVPKYAIDVSEAEIERKVVEGSFGLHRYSQDYWLNHFQDYLKCLDQGHSLSNDLLGLFQDFLKFRKIALPSSNDPAFRSLLSSAELLRFSQNSQILDLMFDCLSYRCKLESNNDAFEDVNAQQQWKLQSDTTYLTLIDVRLRQVTEQLLALDPNNLPLHLNHEEFQAFKQKYAFECRVNDCGKPFKSAGHRDEHERTHFLRFPCTQCDFAIRGFKSMRDLDRHIEKYHMLAEEFAVPENIFATPSQRDTSYRGSRTESVRQNRFLWSGKGREALKKTFKRAVSELRSCTGASDQIQSSFTTKYETHINASADQENLQEISSDLEDELQNIETKVENGYYQSRRLFADEVRSALGSIPSMQARKLEAFCERRLDDAISTFPLLTDSRSPRNLPENIVVTDDDHSEVSTTQEDQYASSSCNSILKPLLAYWSIPETEALPDLLRKFHKDFAAIADYMKTKSAQEVESHLLALSNDNQSTISDVLEELDEQNYEYLSDPLSSQVDTGREATANQKLSDMSSEHYLMSSLYHDAHSDSTSFGFEARPFSMNDPTGSKSSSQIPPSFQRADSALPKRVRQHPKMLCRYCTQEKQFQGEHALDRHIKRFHYRTREVWICKDLSLNKTLLATCGPCRKGKKYSYERDAINHLHSKHSLKDTVSREEIRRWWLKRITESNPTYSGTSADSGRPKKGSLPSPWKLMTLKPSMHHRIERTKGLDECFEGTASNSPHSHTEDNELLNGAMDWESAFREAASDSDKDSPKPVKHDPSDPFDNFIAPDVSFDDILSSIPSISQPQTAVLGNLYAFDKCLLRPDQVPRLPHIEYPRRVALQHEVSELHQKLDGLSNIDPQYVEILKKLRSISEQTMIDLRAWKRKTMQESPTPTYPWPFSLKKSSEAVWRSSTPQATVDSELRLLTDVTDGSSHSDDVQIGQESSRGDQTETS